MLPKYFENLHLAISAITGKPRICSVKDNNWVTDKYKNIPDKEWESCIMNWFHYFQEGKSFVQVLSDYTFCVGGKAYNKRSLIEGLRKCADELEKIINE